MATGTYTGNATDNRNLTGIGFQPDYVSVRANDTGTSRKGQHRPASLTGLFSLEFGALVNLNDGIQSLLADGFQLGTDTSVNTNTVTYHYLAIKNAP